MRERNHYSALQLSEWWNVETDRGIAVAGEDAHFDHDNQIDAEQVAQNLVAYIDEKLTVVRYTRTEAASYQAERVVKRTEP